MGHLLCVQEDIRDAPTQEIAEVVGDEPEEQPHLIGPEAMTGEPRPVGRGFALLDPLLRRPALVVEADDGPVRPCERGDDEAHATKEFPRRAATVHGQESQGDEAG